MVKIVNKYNGYLPINIEKKIKKLLTALPKKYYLGLSTIIILNKIKPRKQKVTLGRYYPRSKNNLPRIEIAIEAIYNNYQKVLIIIPFLGNFLLAHTLYHEIAHHFQQEHKQLKKREWEDYANGLASELLKRKFYLWRIFLRPLKPLFSRLKSR